MALPLFFVVTQIVIFCFPWRHRRGKLARWCSSSSSRSSRALKRSLLPWRCRWRYGFLTGVPSADKFRQRIFTAASLASLTDKRNDEVERSWHSQQAFHSWGRINSFQARRIYHWFYIWQGVTASLCIVSWQFFSVIFVSGVCVMRQIGGLGSLNAAYYCWIILFHVTAAFAVTCDFHVTSLVKACLGPNILGEVP